LEAEGSFEDGWGEGSVEIDRYRALGEIKVEKETLFCFDLLRLLETLRV
jgi:hypothetical protein